MNSRALLGGVGFAGAAVLVGQMTAVAVPGGDDGGAAGGIGTDVIVSSLPNISKYGSINGIAAYALGTTSCNIGDEELDWIQGNNQHPVIAQNIYRLLDGRFEQIGMSWLKHGFCALQGGQCGTCQPAGPGCYFKLGIGCSDPYTSSLNGQQSNLGPRSEVNASTGFFPYPFSAPPAPAVVGRRLQVANDDLNPAMNSGAVYFGEGLYIHPDDAAAGNASNNASYRKLNVGSFSAGAYNLSWTGSTILQKAAIFAWQAEDPEVQITEVEVLGDGLFIVGARAHDNGDGTWRYEYAIYNQTSNRAGGSFSIPMPEGVNPTDIGHSDIDHHSGEPYSTDEWTWEVADGMLTWSSESFADNSDANALRWGTMFNFWFTADSGPAEGGGMAELGMFKPGGPSGADVDTIVPAASTLCGPCPDFNDDGSVDGADLGILLAAWGSDQGCVDINLDGNVDGADLGLLLGAWGKCGQ